MSENKKVLFIINKYSGTGYQTDVEGRILSKCEQLEWEPTLEITQGSGHATELAKEAAHSKKFEVVFAVGGDGTVNEVASGVVHTSQAMGIITKGSGNGLARHLGISPDFKQSLHYLDQMETIMMDSFLVNGHLSINVSGIGFDGHIASLFGKDGKRGWFQYGKLILKEFFSYREFNVHGELDYKKIDQPAYVIAFANSSQFGNNTRIAPNASVCDGWLDVSIVRKIPVFQLPGFAIKLFKGKLAQSPFAEIKKATHINLSFDQPMAYHVDGDGMTPTKEFTIQIQPASIRMVIPAHAVHKV